MGKEEVQYAMATGKKEVQYYENGRQLLFLLQYHFGGCSGFPCFDVDIQWEIQKPLRARV